MTREYDVAISFLSRDEAVARRLRDILSKDLRVFLSTHEQEAISGTDGVETFSRVFKIESELTVVLFRDDYGKTPWTRVELEAIKQRFLDDGPDFLFVVMLDEESKPPPWFPNTRLRFNLPDFGVDQAAGAIKLRALEVGASFRRETSAERAKRAEARIAFDLETRELTNSPAGVDQVSAAFVELKAELVARSEEVVKAAPALGFVFAQEELRFGITSRRGSLEVALRFRWSNALEGVQLTAVLTPGTILIPGQPGTYFERPPILERIELQPVRTESSGWCWVDESGRSFTSPELAQELFARLLEAVEVQRGP